MKRIATLICVLLVLSFALPAFSACGRKDGEDEYGFERPENCWLSETFALNDLYFPKPKFGSGGGKTGLMKAESFEGLKERANDASDNDDFYTVYCFFYGTCKPEELQNIRTYLSLTFVTNDGVYYGGDPAIFYDDYRSPDVEIHAGNVKIESGSEEIQWDKAPDQRIKLIYDSSDTPEELPQEKMTTVFGIVEITFWVKQKGTLYVDLSVDIDGERETRMVYPSAKIPEGKRFFDGAASIAHIENVSVGYLTQSDYNGGDYAEESIRSNATFETDQPCYMVLDFSIRTLIDNDGTRSMSVLTHAPGTLDISVEEAPTTKFETSTLNGKAINAVYGIPAVTGETKTIRMLIRLLPVGEETGAVSVIMFGQDGAELDGDVFQYDMIGV